MHLEAFIRPVDRRAVVVHGLAACVGSGAVLAAPLLTALLRGEWEAARSFALTGFGACAAGLVGLGLLGASPRRTALDPRGAMIVAALAYVIFSLVGGIALRPWLSLLDGTFESLSGYTTTGLSVLDPAEVPGSVLLFRSLAQWLGGIGIVVASVVVLRGAGATARALGTVELKEDDLIGSALATGRVALATYVALTAACVVVLMITGLDVWHALLVSLATLSTGGFAAGAPDPLAGPGLAAAMGCLPFMLVGALPLLLHRQALRDGMRAFVGRAEVRALLLLTASSVALFGLLRAGGAAGLGRGAFHAVSALTTTGFSLDEPASWSAGERALSLVLMIVGGAGGSTAGGIKLERMLVLFALLRWIVRRLQLPREASVPVSVGGEALGDDELRRVFAFLAAYGLLLAASTAALTACGSGVSDALFETVSAVGTVGLSSGLTSPDLPVAGKLVLMLDMAAGRLEILPLLLLLHPRTWIAPRRSPS